MRAVDFLVDKLTEYGITDTFGIPGQVIMKLIYAMDQNEKITPHLCYNEQAAAFCALGYAQVHGTLGAAYSTKGPGFTNMITAISEAYYESIPAVFITGHSVVKEMTKMRNLVNQEIHAVEMVRTITKYAVEINDINMFAQEVEKALSAAMNGRKGPVVIDILESLFDKEIEESVPEKSETVQRNILTDEVCDRIKCKLEASSRPVILIGNGVLLSDTVSGIQALSEKFKIPVLSSRCSHDLMSASQNYFGYIGSHGVRYSNFILSKTDLIIALGNRMAFPVESQSFRGVTAQAETIRIDIDEGEFEREIPNSEVYCMDLKELVPALAQIEVTPFDEWFKICAQIREQLRGVDCSAKIRYIAELLSRVDERAVLVSDVGNNSFLLSMACIYGNITNRALYARTFSTLGGGLPKAIGAYYQTRGPVFCIIGDQGLQMNIQELQYIAANQLPVFIMLLNNMASGMIRNVEKRIYGGKYLHVTPEDGYSIPDYQKVCQAYGLKYYRESDIALSGWETLDGPACIEIEIDSGDDLELYLPKGNPCQKLYPYIDDALYERLDALCR